MFASEIEETIRQWDGRIDKYAMIGVLFVAMNGLHSDILEPDAPEEE